jgi:hypothetical protein
MKTSEINLLPTSIRERTQAGVRAGRVIAAALVVTASLIVLGTHSRIVVNRAEDRLGVTEGRADEAMRLEAEETVLTARITELQTYIDAYRAVAPAIRLSDVIATVVQALPEGATLEEIIANVERERLAPNGIIDSKQTGRLRLEILGFAVSDGDIASIVTELGNTAPFEDVGLDFSRSRQVRGHRAREFRLSLYVDLTREYIVASPVASAATSGVEGEH